MAKVKRENPQVFAQIENRIKELTGSQAKVGWFESARYENGTPVAYVAAIQEYGAYINHPGGTPYKIVNGQAVFVSKSSPEAASLPKTKPHPIVIPPRPFMRPTVAEKTPEWKKILLDGSKAILRGNATSQLVMEAVSSKAAGDIAKTIARIWQPPLKEATVKARARRLKSHEITQSLRKPLVDTGMLIQSITHVVENDK